MITRSRWKMRSAALVIATLFGLGLSATPHTEETETPGAVSRFAGEVTRETYPETDAPATPPVFRWDFSSPDVVHTYSYEQEVRTTSDMGLSVGDAPGTLDQTMSSTGVLLVRSRGSGTGELVLKDVKVRMESDAGGDDGSRSMEQTIPPIVVQGLKEDGSGAFGDNPQDMFLKMLFHLPSKALRVGESVDVPAQMPFNAMGSVLQVKGRFRITLTRYVRIAENRCAQLDVDTDISQLNVPPELQGEYRCSLRGTSVFYFDVQHRRFQSGTTAVVMQAFIDAPMPKMAIPGEAMPDLPERSKLSMVSDNLIRVQLQE